MEEKKDDNALATALKGTFSDTFKSMCQEKFTQDPAIKTIPLEENKGNIEVSSYKKFAVRSYITIIYYYPNVRDKEKNKPNGTLILYIKDSGIVKFMKALGYLNSEEDSDQAIVMDKCGEFCNVIGDAFRKDLTGLGYANVEMSAPYKYRDVVPGNVPIHSKLTHFHELTIFLFDAKPVILDVYIQ